MCCFDYMLYSSYSMSIGSGGQWVTNILDSTYFSTTINYDKFGWLT